VLLAAVQPTLELLGNVLELLTTTTLDEDTTAELELSTWLGTEDELLCGGGATAELDGSTDGELES